MDRDGNPKNPHSDESSDINPYTFADLFCAKGFVAAARYRCDPEKVEESHQYIEEIGTTILNHSFRSGQIDPRNPTATTESPEVRQHGPGMIYLGALALVAGKSAQGWVQRTGIALMSHIFDAHVAADDAIPPLLPNDLWEAVTRDDTPYIDRGMIVSDPGHSIEFVGLASRYLRLFADSFPADKRELVESMTLRLPEILFRNFDNGFRREVGGITKTIDLITQKPVDANLPWWSLPESMRSAMEVHRFAGSDRKRSRCREIFAQAHNAFVSHYVRRGDDRVPDLWYQSRNAKGLVVDVIPACPDIDPGYHTNMSILEALELAETEIL
jgi:hypothetical protein